jgi:hypothetical protein
MGIDEFEKNLEMKLEHDRDLERQRMIRELKNHKEKTSMNSSMVVVADDFLNKRNQKVEEKQAVKKLPSDDEDKMRKWGSAPSNTNQDIKTMLLKR